MLDSVPYFSYSFIGYSAIKQHTSLVPQSWRHILFWLFTNVRIQFWHLVIWIDRIIDRNGKQNFGCTVHIHITDLTGIFLQNTKRTDPLSDGAYVGKNEILGYVQAHGEEIPIRCPMEGYIVGNPVLKDGDSVKFNSPFIRVKPTSSKL